MYLIRELTDRSYKWIAQRFARQDHTTAMNSCARINQLATSNSDVRQALLELKQMIFEEQVEQDRTDSDVALF
jgi:chromosomal replication initiation ATPase DnaA